MCIIPTVAQTYKWLPVYKISFVVEFVGVPVNVVLHDDTVRVGHVVCEGS